MIPSCIKSKKSIPRPTYLLAILTDKVREIMKIAQDPVSLETPIGEEEDSHLGDFIPDDDAPEIISKFFRSAWMS